MRTARFHFTRPVLAIVMMLALAFPGRDAGATVRPAKNEDSSPVAPGALRISAGYELANGPYDGEARAITAAIAAGVAPGTDLTIEGSHLQLDSENGDTATGWGDVTMAMRAQVMEEHGRKPELDFTLGVKLPSGDHVRNLGTEETDFYAYLRAAHAAGPVRLHVSAGFTIVGLPAHPHEQEDSFLYGLTLNAPLGRRVELVLDLFAEHLANVRRNPFGYLEDYGHGMIGGLRVGRGGVTWDIAVFHALDGPDGLWGGTGGITVPLSFR